VKAGFPIEEAVVSMSLVFRLKYSPPLFLAQTLRREWFAISEDEKTYIGALNEEAVSGPNVLSPSVNNR
jgi:hypothetical protein